jgi:hypothetical protein
MPDGIQQPPGTAAPELAADATDGRLIRGVRRNLVLWSGGTTLLVLVVLAVALYAAVAGSLASSGIEQLEARMSLVRGERPDPRDATRLGFTFGGGGSGTLAIGIDPDGNIIRDRRIPLPPTGLPDRAAAAAAAVSGRDIRTTSISGTPVRLLTETVDVEGQVYTLQVVQDRTAEQRSLETMLAVHRGPWSCSSPLGSGWGAPALVPTAIAANQRIALRRQRGSSRMPAWAADAADGDPGSVDYLLATDLNPWRGRHGTRGHR